MSEHQESFFMDMSIGAIIPLSTYLVGKNLPNEVSVEQHGQHDYNEDIRFESEIVIMEQSPCTDEFLFAKQLNQEGNGFESQSPMAVSMMFEENFNQILFEKTSSSEGKLMEPCTDEFLFAKQLNQEGNGFESQSPMAVSMMFEKKSNQILSEKTSSSECKIMEQSPCIEEFLFANQYNQDRMVEPQSSDADVMMFEQPTHNVESHNENSIEQLLGHEEVWFEQTSQAEDFWLNQLPDCEKVKNQMPQSSDHISIQQLQSPDAVHFEQSRESVIETMNKSRLTENIGPIDDTNGKVIAEEGIMSRHTKISNGTRNKTTTSMRLIKKGACDKVKMFVRTTSDKQTKKLCCPFCLKLFSKLARHMEDMHDSECFVRRFMKLPKRSKERRAIQDALRKDGLNKFNDDPDLNKGELLVSRRPSENLNKLPEDYTTCPYCSGYYTKTNLRHHAAVCQTNPERKSRILLKLAAMVEGRIHSNASIRLVRVVSFMRDDVIVKLIRYDWLLIVFGNKMCCKYTPHYQENMIRARLRLSGRLLFEMKKIDSEVSDFASIYHVERYDALVSAIKVIGRFNPETNEFGAPAMASCAVTFVKLIGKYLCAEYIRLRDRENKTETEDFLTYMETDIGISINRLVAETQAKMRLRKQENIPSMDDVRMLMTYVNIQLKKSYEALANAYSEDEWIKLAKLVVGWIIVFNRKRVGEVQNIRVEEFLCRQSIDEESNEQMMSTMSEDAQAIARKFKRMKIRGKKGRPVPVLLKPIVDKAINLLLSYRQEAGTADREFLFELPLSCALNIKVVNGCEVMRNISSLCGATNPTSLRGTYLRKHMATTCISLELNDALVSEVADFMGHADKIHREYYRKNPLQREVVQIAQLLETAAGKIVCDDDDDNDHDLCGGNEACRCGDTSHSKTVNTKVVNEPVNLDNNDNHMMMDDPEQRVENNSAGAGGHDSKKKFAKKRWSGEEIAIVRKVFSVHLKSGSLPSQSEICNQQNNHAALQSRTWQQIKTWISNQHKKHK